MSAVTPTQVLIVAPEDESLRAAIRVAATTEIDDAAVERILVKLRALDEENRRAHAERRGVGHGHLHHRVIDRTRHRQAQHRAWIRGTGGRHLP